MMHNNTAILYKNGKEIKRFRIQDRKGTLKDRKMKLKFIFASIKRIAYNNPNDLYYIDLITQKGPLYQ